MGRIARVLSFFRTVRNLVNVTDVTVDVGGGDNVTCENYAPIGDDSMPLAIDYALTATNRATGRLAIVAYLDPNDEQKSGGGEKRIYARNSNGESVVEVWLKADGSVTGENDQGSFDLQPDGSFNIQNANGFIKLLADGTVDINGATIDPSGAVDSPTSLAAPSIVVNGAELDQHLHPAGIPPGNTGPNL